MKYRVRFTDEAATDLARLYAFQAERNPETAREALDAIREGIRVLEIFPFSTRKVMVNDPMLRELLISYGSSGYVAMYEIEPGHVVTILAVRHQLEDDYH